jgi:hypothetical protein
MAENREIQENCELVFSVSYAIQMSYDNTGSTPVSATKPFRISELQNHPLSLTLESAKKGAISDRIRGVRKKTRELSLSRKVIGRQVLATGSEEVNEYR